MASAFKKFGTEDCVKILKTKFNSTDFTASSFVFRPVNEKVGFLCSHYYLEIYYKDASENKILQCFAKIKAETGVTTNFLEQTGGFTKECAFYRNFVSDLLDNGIEILNDCIPASYAVCSKGYLIFEDLSLRKYTTIDHRPPLSLEYVKLVLDSLAKFHCSAMIFEEKMKKSTGESFRLDEKYPVVFKESFFTYAELPMKIINGAKTGVKTIIDLTKDDLKVNIELFKTFVEEIYDNFPQIVKPSTKFRNTICHGDLWTSNFMFTFDTNGTPISSILVDFQMNRYSPPAQDLMMLLYMTTNLEFREKYLKVLTNYYYEKVVQMLKLYNLSAEKILPYDQYIESCDYYRLMGICLALNHNQLIMVPQEDSKDMFNNIENIMFGDRTKHVQKYFTKCAEYRKKSLENIKTLEQVLIEQGKLQLNE